ncbi:FimV/HubP family polar landmark protein [Pseudorhodoferax sp. Leaf267]|uniref:FimV/HubP family polar landmark protein n=1 Tax=Pseudorhodoferax sp. Leaf267 TaxID=1736316 RepID=UPI000713F72E|nr:FimV/HubP family polar landmark protein [Pseudorhodoferax sp. Leaf267]KQP14334.1 hypothetical protein ASF43_16100 [Pseudorhodoferax sp. Leaf267]
MAVLCASAPPAHALSLGRITVLSALGEPLLAEIDLPDISAEESATLQASIAAPEAFRASGLEYNSALQGVRITQQRRADGRPVLRLTSEQPANVPFVDVILQVNWASGRVVRDYTILLDPPAQRQAPAATATAPQVSPPPAAAAPSAAAPQAQPSAPPPPAAAAPAPAPARPATPAAAPARPTAIAPAGTGPVTVRPGDTAGRIAAANKAPSISLDQMLVAMLRSNPDAFIQGNVNRLRSGSVLSMPTPEQAASVPAPEASRLVTAQSRDFNAFRGRLAANVPPVQTEGADRSASGRVQTQVDENRAAAGAPDKLTLSKGGLQARATEERIAREKATAQADERVAELSRNISDLNRLGVAVPASAPGASPPPANTASAAEPASSPAPAAPPPTATASAPTAPASADAVVTDAPRPADQPATWLGALLANRTVLAAAAILLALLAALGLYRARQRRRAEADDAILTNRSQPDSFFGSSGGQRVDTADALTPASALAAHASGPLDAAGDVDPIAEADVYLAYGRDLQAEEILNEALRTDPTRVAIHAKLAEIHAKRRDSTAFLAVAAQAHAVTAGAGPQWAQIATLGEALVPGDPLWAAPSDPSPAGTAALVGAGLAGAAVARAQTTPADAAPQPPAAPATTQDDPDFDLDLNLDFDIDKPPVAGTPMPSTPQARADLDDADLDADLAGTDVDVDALDLDLELDPQARPAAQGAAPANPAPEPPGFDLGSLNLDLGDDGTADAPAAPAAEASGDDPLATKLALAEEFHAIGDVDGARALTEEVLAEATGPLRAQAQRFLDTLG